MKEILYSRILGKEEKHLLILHGLFGQSDNWNTLGKKFAEYYTTHLIDLRNHGRSFHSGEMDYNSTTKDILDYMDYYGIKEAYLMGHSLGGRIAVEFALNYPDSIEKLIIVDMTPKVYPPHHQGIIKALNAVDFDKIQSRKEVEDVLKQYIPQAAVRQFLLKNVYQKEKGKYAFRFNLEILIRLYNDLIANTFTDKIYDKPVFFLGGAKSDYITELDHPLIRKYFPKAEIGKVSNAGHWLHAENPDEFFNKVIEFLNK